MAAKDGEESGEENVELVTRTSAGDLEANTDDGPSKSDQSKKEKKEVPLATFTFWFGTLAVVSTILTVVNKYLMLKYPFANAILFIQSVMSAAVLITASRTGMAEVKPFTFAQVRIFFVSSLLKVGQVVTALVALPHVAIATVMVFRNFAIAATAFIDRFFFGSKLSMKAMLALVFVLAGSLVYTGGDVNYDAEGYMWLGINAVLYVASVIYNKIFQTRLQEGNVQTAQGNAVIEQTWMAVWGVGFMYGSGEIQKGCFSALSGLSSTAVVLFIATGLAAPVIGVAYARCFAIASPTTVTVAATVNKCVAIIVAAWAFSTVLSPTQYGGLICTVLSGAWYAEEKKRK